MDDWLKELVIFIELSPVLVNDEFAVILEVPDTFAKKDGKLFIA